PGSRAIPSFARGWANTGVTACCRATPSSGSSPTSTSCTGRCSVGQTCEDAERRLLLAGRRDQAGLPADVDVRVVAQHEPGPHVDPRIRACHGVRLPHVGRLARERDAEDPIGWRLPAVLGDPDALLAPELVDEADQRVDVPEGDRASTGLACRRVARL